MSEVETMVPGVEMTATRGPTADAVARLCDAVAAIEELLPDASHGVLAELRQLAEEHLQVRLPRAESVASAAPEMSDAVVRLESVAKHFPIAGGDRVVDVLRGLDLAVERGSMVGIVGPSGSGKSTLLQLLGALDVPSAGSVEIDGHDLVHIGEAERTRLRAASIGFVFQQFNLIPNLSAIENVELALEATRVRKAGRRPRALELLEMVGMADRASHQPSKLSGGEQQRVAIARALANDPPILLADEPTGSLDSRTGRSITSLLRRLCDEHGRTVLVVTHAEDVARRCDVVWRIEDGRLRRELTAAERRLERDRRSAEIARLRSDLDVTERVAQRLHAEGFTDAAAVRRSSVKQLSKVTGGRKQAERLLENLG